jgi:hypothetical protein
MPCAARSNEAGNSGTSFLQPVRLAGGSWLLLVCSKRKILMAGLDRD